MTWYEWFTSVALLVCVIGLAFHLLRLVRSGIPMDYSRPAGKVGPAIAWSFTRAMDPRKKESASLHLPTYAAGVCYHAGTFVSMLWFALFFIFDVRPPETWVWPSIAVLTVSAACGLGILVKRIAIPKLRLLSNPDDYVSNILLTGFQLLTIGMLWDPVIAPVYYLWSGVLLLYAPAGKLRHAVYFVAARIHAGYFYGRRGIWPVSRRGM